MAENEQNNAQKKDSPRIVFWTIVAVGLLYMYKNVFKK